MEQRANYPLKESTPMMAKMSKNRQHTIVTLVIEGREDRSAFTISFMP